MKYLPLSYLHKKKRAKAMILRKIKAGHLFTQGNIPFLA